MRTRADAVRSTLRAQAAVLLFLGTVAALPVSAVPAGLIEGLQMPVWIDRHGAQRPAWPGMRVHSGDRVRTGSGARVLVRLDEGSHVRLGADAELVLREFTPPPERGGRFRAFLDVLEGAFRFTTTALSRRARRDLDISIAGVTAGIRGTDVWGKAATDRDIVCLIEGEITITRGADAPVRMRDPLTFYVAPRGQPALPVAPVDAAQLARWAAEVALRSESGLMRPGGGWRVQLASHATQGAALADLARLEAAGYAASVTRAEVGGRTWHRLSIGEFSGPEEARAFIASTAATLGYATPWVAPEP